MAIEKIDKIKREYTDKYVMVDGGRPELARFNDQVGRVKTVNMSGRALVEFQDYHKNIGWFDIDLDYLKVVDKPQPKVEKPAAKKAAAKPAAKKPAASTGEKKLSPLEMARRQGAAAKGGGADAKPAAEKPAPAQGKMSTADILAMARGKATKSKPAVEAAPPAPEPTPEPVPEPVVEATPASESSASSSVEKVDRSSMSVEQMIAYCREHDTK